MIEGRITQSYAFEHDKTKEIETPGRGGAFASRPPDLDRQVEGDPNISPRCHTTVAGLPVRLSRNTGGVCRVGKVKK